MRAVSATWGTLFNLLEANSFHGPLGHGLKQEAGCRFHKASHRVGRGLLKGPIGWAVTPYAVLTRLWRNVALPLLQCEARMSELLADIVSAFGRELDAASLEKTRRYLEALKTAVRPDDLPAYGLAYLEQLHNPDPRYSGC